jgi:hypothetical protein
LQGWNQTDGKFSSLARFERDTSISGQAVIAQSPLRYRARRAQTVRPPLLAEALVAFEGGQASLILTGAARYGARDMTAIIGPRETVSSRGPDLKVQSVELRTEAGVARPALSGCQRCVAQNLWRGLIDDSLLPSAGGPRRGAPAGIEPRINA